MHNIVNIKPADFTDLKDIDSTIQEDLRYFTANNFIGRPITGYKNTVCLLTTAAATALKGAQEVLKPRGLGLKIFDAYRPQSAVDDFIAWSEDPKDQKMKAHYYPHLDKSRLFPSGYIAKRSGHTRGSTVDLTLVTLKTGNELDMGTPFDFMDPLSHPLTGPVSAEQQKNRLLLREIMQEQGFIPITTEWWHFTLQNEPYPNQYFNFPII